MMSVIHIHLYEYLAAIECPFLWRYTSSLCHLRLVNIISHQSRDTSWICVRYIELQHCRLMVADYLGTS
jgi:hypothetical protein